ncbi:unnamed protein product [Lota lota]
MMCFENLSMPENMSRVIFSLLLFGTALQGLKALNVSHFETAEASVGQNISLPCIYNDTLEIKIAQIEWHMKLGAKLVVYLVQMGPHYFRGNLVFHPVMGDDNKLRGSYLELYHAQVNDNGTYVCELTTYPHGSISKETRLEVKDAVEVTCDMNSTLEVCAGDNVTVHCELHLYPQARYIWLKNETVVSETSSLEVRWIDASQAGVYTLMVSTGQKTLQRSFNIIILTPTESPRTDSTSQNTNHSSTGVYAPTTGPVEANSTLETGQNVSSSVPSSQATTANPNATESQNESSTVQPITGSSATTLGLETHHGSTEKTANVTEEHVPDDVHHQHTSSSTTLEMGTKALGGLTETSANLSTSRRTTEDKTVVVTETAGMRFHFWWLAIVLCLVACVMLGFLYRRHTIQKRLDRPPTFKPPPPPRKYTSVKPHHIPMNSSCSWFEG